MSKNKILGAFLLKPMLRDKAIVINGITVLTEFIGQICFYKQVRDKLLFATSGGIVFHEQKTSI